MTEPTTLGTELRRYRKLRGISAQALAEKAGVAVATVFNVEHGRFTPSWFVLTCLAEALDLDCSVTLQERAR